MLQQLGEDALDLEGVVRVLLQPLDVFTDVFVEALADQVFGVGSDLGDQRGQAVDELVGRPAAHRPAQAEIAQGADFPADGVGDQRAGLFVLHDRVEAQQQFVEHRLMAPLAGQHAQCLGQRRGEVELAQAADHLGFDKGAHALVMQRGDAEMRDPGEPAADRFGIAWMAQPASQARGEVQLLQLGQHQRRGEEMGGDEARQVAADARLAARDDRRVRDRQAERVTEQRGDGEPVGDRADHGGFGEGGDIAPGRVDGLETGRDDVQQGGQQQQQAGDQLHPRNR